MKPPLDVDPWKGSVTHKNVFPAFKRISFLFQGKIVECVNCGCRGCSG